MNVVTGFALQVRCQLEEKEDSWSKLNEVVESITSGLRVETGPDFSGCEVNKDDEELLGRLRRGM